MIEFTIPGEVRGKQRTRATRQGRVYTPSETINAEAFIRMIAAEAMQGRPPLDGPVILTLDIRVGVPRSFTKRRREAALLNEISPVTKPDLDNVVKLISDALNGITFRDDKQIVLLVAGKKYAEQAETRVTVSPSRAD